MLCTWGADGAASTYSGPAGRHYRWCPVQTPLSAAQVVEYAFPFLSLVMFAKRVHGVQSSCVGGLES